MLTGNTAIGGAGASGDAGGDGIGGGLALENNATATITNTSSWATWPKAVPAAPGPTAATASAAASPWPSVVPRTRRPSASATAR